MTINSWTLDIIDICHGHNLTHSLWGSIRTESIWQHILCLPYFDEYDASSSFFHHNDHNKKPKKHKYDLTASCRWASNIRLHKTVYIAHTVNVSVDVLMINIKIAISQSPLHAFLMAKWLQANTLSFEAVLGSFVVTFLF